MPLYLSGYNASSWAWSLVPGTSVWLHSLSSHRLCALPGQSPGSGKDWEREKCCYWQNIHPYRYSIVPGTKQCFDWGSPSSLTFSSQSSFTAKLLGFRSWRERNLLAVSYSTSISRDEVKGILQLRNKYTHTPMVIMKCWYWQPDLDEREYCTLK